MKVVSGKNICKLIILNLVLCIGVLLIWLGYVAYTFWDFEINLKTELRRIEEEYIKSKKNSIRESVLDFTHRLDTEQHASRAENEDMVILDLRSMERGDEIDTMLVFPDRTDLLNGLLSDNKEDTQVREFRKNLLNGIKKQGEVFVKYRDRKPNTDKARTKMAYLKIYPKRSWIIAQGFYFDELITKINQFKEQNRKLFHEKIRISLAVFCFTLLASLCISLFFLHKINSLFSKR